MKGELEAMKRTFRIGLGLPPPLRGEDWTDVALRALQTGRGAVVPRYVLRLGPAVGRVLDFGAGAGAFYTRALLRLGFDVDGYDLPSSRADLRSSDGEVRRRAMIYFLAVEDEVLVERLEAAAYDLAFASNVLNVQPSRARLRETVLEVRAALRPGGTFVANFPENPRPGLAAGERGDRHLELALRRGFDEVRRVEGALVAGDAGEDRPASSPLWVCR